MSDGRIRDTSKKSPRTMNPALRDQAMQHLDLHRQFLDYLKSRMEGLSNAAGAVIAAVLAAYSATHGEHGPAVRPTIQ